LNFKRFFSLEKQFQNVLIGISCDKWGKLNKLIVLLMKHNYLIYKISIYFYDNVREFSKNKYSMTLAGESPDLVSTPLGALNAGKQKVIAKAAINSETKTIIFR